MRCCVARVLSRGPAYSFKRNAVAPSAALVQIEQAVRKLSQEERLWLIERLAHDLRQNTVRTRPDFEAALVAMAADQEIQQELAQIAQEFAGTEMDGLE